MIVALGESQTFQIREGNIARIVGSTGAAGAAYLLTADSGSLSPEASWSVTPGATVLTPARPGTRRVIVSCTAGSITVTEEAADVVSLQRNSAGTGWIDPVTGAEVALGGSLAQRLTYARDKAYKNNIFDNDVMVSPPTIAANAAAISGASTYRITDAGGYNRMRLYGATYGGGITGYATGGVWANQVLVGPGGVTSQAGKGFKTTVKFTGTVIQLLMTDYSLALGYSLNRIHVNGYLLQAVPTPLASNSEGNIQLTFATRGTYEISVEFEQSTTFNGVSMSADDTLHAWNEIPLPIIGLGDSYLAGTISITGTPFGGKSFPAAFREISGTNLVSLGVSSTGYGPAYAATFPLTHTERLAQAVLAVNTSNSPLVCIWMGTNDVDTAAGVGTSAQVQTVLSYLLANITNTSTKIAVFGAWPQKRNLSANLLATDAAILAGVTAINNNRCKFVKISTASPPWVIGNGSTGGAGGAAGNSRTITGNDSIHPSAEGAEYLARRSVDALIATAQENNW